MWLYKGIKGNYEVKQKLFLFKHVKADWLLKTNNNKEW